MMNETFFFLVYLWTANQWKELYIYLAALDESIGAADAEVCQTAGAWTF